MFREIFSKPAPDWPPNTEELVLANQVTAWSRMFREIFSKPAPDWLPNTEELVLANQVTA